MEEALTCEQLQRWEILNRIEPVGPYRLDYLVGYLAWSMALPYRDPKKPVPSLDSYIPRWDPPKPKTREEILEETAKEWEASTSRLF